MTASVLVLGGTGGIGSALARRLAARGVRPFLVARDAARLRAVAEETGAGWHAADVTDPAALRQAVAAAGSPLSGLAVAVGSIVLKPVARVTEADLVDTFRLNAVVPALAVQAALPALTEGEGSVVLFSTVAARRGFPNHAPIAMAKAAVEGLTLSLAAELAPRIRVNCIAPSLTRTALSEPLTRNAQMAEAIARQHPIGRLGEAEDVAALADLLLAPGGWITGQVIGVDGGRGAVAGK